MNFLCFNHREYGVILTPTSFLSDIFRYYGIHTVDSGIYSSFFDNKSFSFDWTISYHENIEQIIQAYNASKKYNSKFCFHLEWLMPWRTGIHYYDRDWGYDIVPDQGYIEAFKSLSEIWDKADVRSCASKYFIKPLQDFFGSTKEVKIKYPGANLNMAIKAQENFANWRWSIINDVCTVTRIAPHKKVDLIARALVKCNRPIKWALINLPKEKNNEIYNIINGSKVKINNIKIFNSVQESHGIEIFFNILCSKISVHGWTGVPPNESLLCGRYALVYDDLLQREYFGDTCEFYKDEDELAQKINYYLDHVQESTDKAEESKIKILKEEATTGTMYQEAKQILRNMGY